MNNNITVDFSNIISELETKNIKLCFLKDRGLFIEDNQKHLYKMNDLDHGSYLDKLIKTKRKIVFKYVGEEVNIEEWEREIWSVSEVNDFINRQGLNDIETDQELSKEYILKTLSKVSLWKAGEGDSFTFSGWNLMIRKEEEIYKPFTFILDGLNINNHSTWGRRYINIEDAFLHVLNHFNENVNIKNRYKTLNEALFDSKSEISE